MPLIRSNIGTILPLIQAQLVSSLGFPTERVVIQRPRATLEMPATVQADQYAVIQLADEMMNRRQIGSAGRYDARVNRTVLIAAWVRLNLDEPCQDSSWYTDSALGYLPLENSLFNALLTFIPTDANGNGLAIPFHPVSISGAEIRRADWGSAAVSIDVEFYRDVNQGHIFTGA